MGVQLNDIAKSFLRTTDLPSMTTYTMMTWVMVQSRSTDNDAATPLFYRNNGAGNTEWAGVYVKNNATATATNLMLNTHTTADTLGSLVSVFPNWHHVTLTRAANVYTAYFNGVLDIQFTDATAVTNTRLYYAGSEFLAGDAPTANYANVKMWDGAALTADEITLEMKAIRPIRWADIHAWYPFWNASTANKRDYSGHGFDWSDVGAPASVRGPILPWGSSPIWMQPPSRRWILGTH